MSKDYERWCQVEQAECKVEQLLTLMNLFGNEYIDMDTEMFCRMAKQNHEGMSNVMSLAMDALTVCHGLLDSAVNGREGDAE